MAIAALPVYVSIVDHFLICAPDAEHRDSHLKCGLTSYLERGWCRMEMLAKACGSGLKHMYVCSDDGRELLELIREDFDCLSFSVYDGVFSREEDKLSLVNPILGLYSLMLRQSRDEDVHGILNTIKHDKCRFFPPRMSLPREGGARTTKLFGDLATTMETYVEQMYPETRKPMTALTRLLKAGSRATLFFSGDEAVDADCEWPRC